MRVSIDHETLAIALRVVERNIYMPDLRQRDRAPFDEIRELVRQGRDEEYRRELYGVTDASVNACVECGLRLRGCPECGGDLVEQEELAGEAVHAPEEEPVAFDPNVRNPRTAERERLQAERDRLRRRTPTCPRCHGSRTVEGYPLCRGCLEQTIWYMSGPRCSARDEGDQRCVYILNGGSHDGPHFTDHAFDTARTPRPTCMNYDRNTGWYCSLPTGHDGYHVAHASHDPNDQILATWPQEGLTPESPAPVNFDTLLRTFRASASEFSE